MRDVLLVKAGRVKVAAHGSEQYPARISFSIAGVPFAFIRGYTWADIRVGTKRLRVVNTHLESQSSLVAQAQAAELLAGPGAVTGRPLVLVCDCNSDPLNGSDQAHRPDPDTALGALPPAHRGRRPAPTSGRSGPRPTPASPPASASW